MEMELFREFHFNVRFVTAFDFLLAKLAAISVTPLVLFRALVGVPRGWRLVLSGESPRGGKFGDRDAVSRGDGGVRGGARRGGTGSDDAECRATGAQRFDGRVAEVRRCGAFVCGFSLLCLLG